MEKWEIKFWFIFGIVIALLLVGGIFTLIKIKTMWDNQCSELGLSKKCDSIDVCKKDCEDLDKTYYRFEGGGFSGFNCWCLTEDKNTIQIR